MFQEGEETKQLIQNISHDLRTPFSGILQLTEHMLSQETDPTKKMELGLILESGHRIFALLSKIMETIQLEKNQVDRYFSLKALLDDIQTMNAALIQQKKLAFTIQIDPTVPDEIFGDYFRLQSILLNLVSNAIKFTKMGFVKLTVDCVEKKSDQISLVFKISDSGIGIPVDRQDFIFEKFSRIVPTDQGLYDGIGFGLSMVKRFVNELQGSIDVISEVGKGSTFICKLDFQLNQHENGLETKTDVKSNAL